MADSTADGRGRDGTDRPRPTLPATAPRAVLEMLASVLADLTYPAQPWQIVVVAETFGADADTVTRLHRLPAATYPSLGHIAHAYARADDPGG